MKKTKFLTVLGVLLAMGITACNNTPKSSEPKSEEPTSQPASTPKDSSSKHTHEWGEWTVVTPATCTEKGEEQRTCSTCNEVQKKDIDPLGHVFEEGDEYYQDGVKYLECKNCHSGVLEWSALDYDKDETRDPDKHTDYVRFNTPQYKGQDKSVPGTLLVYKISVQKAVKDAGLAFDILPHSQVKALFVAIDNDTGPGYEENEAGELEKAKFRYGLFVNGERIQIGQDNYGDAVESVRGWFDWPVKFDLKAGENTIALLGLGGYRAQMYNFRLTNIPKYEHAHDFEAKVSEEAAGEGYIASQVMACTENCGKTAIQWSALDYDQTKTAAKSDDGKGPESRDSGKAIRFSSQVSGSGEGHVNKGTHIVFNVKTPAAENVGLAMYSSARNDVATAFDKFENDTAAGYEQINGEWVRPDSRYGVKVDGQIYMLEANGEGWHGTGWYNFPVVIPSLTAGIHEIEVFNYGGYRVDMYNFALTNLPPVQGSTFTLSETWSSDENGHWKTVTGQDDVKFVYREHILVKDESKTDVPATCTEKGKAFLKCSICGKQVEQETPALGHKWVAGAVVVDGTKATQETECSVCHEKSSVTGGVYGTFAWKDALQGKGTVGSDGKVSAGDNDILVFEVPAAGTYVVTLNMQGSNGNGTRVLNGSGTGNDGHAYAISANGKAGTFLGAGKTYAEFFGENQTAWVDVAFGEVELVAGRNEIKITALNGNYRTRINPNGNVTVAAKAA